MTIISAPEKPRIEDATPLVQEWLWQHPRYFTIAYDIVAGVTEGDQSGTGVDELAEWFDDLLADRLVNKSSPIVRESLDKLSTDLPDDYIERTNWTVIAAELMG